MTINELSAYYKYTVKIKALNSEIDYLRGSAPGLCAKYGSGGSSGSGVSDVTGNMAIHIAEKVSELERLKYLCEMERAKISHFVLELVPDPLVSAMMYARFILCMSLIWRYKL